MEFLRSHTKPRDQRDILNPLLPSLSPADYNGVVNSGIKIFFLRPMLCEELPFYPVCCYCLRLLCHFCLQLLSCLLSENAWEIPTIENHTGMMSWCYAANQIWLKQEAGDLQHHMDKTSLPTNIVFQLCLGWNGWVGPENTLFLKLTDDHLLEIWGEKQHQN